MFIPRIVFAFCIIVFGAGVACGQDYPNKVIRIMTLAGGSNEFKARLIAQGITGPLGQPVVMDFRPTPIIVNDTVAKAPPDGYTMAVLGGSLWIQPFFTKVPYDAVRDFSPISLVDRSPAVVAVHPSLPVKSIKELIFLAKAKPGEIDHATNLPGNTSWLAVESFKSMAGINMRGIPYKNLAQTVIAIIGGEVQVMFTDPVLVMPHAKAGRLRALAVTSATPSALAPGLPTVAASGLPGYEFVSVTAMYAPAKVPEAIIRRLNQEVVRVLNSPDIKQKLLDSGIEALSSSPEELAATIKSDMARIGKLAKDMGVSPQ